MEGDDSPKPQTVRIIVLHFAHLCEVLLQFTEGSRHDDVSLKKNCEISCVARACGKIMNLIYPGNLLGRKSSMVELSDQHSQRPARIILQQRLSLCIPNEYSPHNK